jgi:hypothetical protein
VSNADVVVLVVSSLAMPRSCREGRIDSAGLAGVRLDLTLAAGLAPSVGGSELQLLGCANSPVDLRCCQLADALSTAGPKMLEPCGLVVGGYSIWSRRHVRLRRKT